MKTHARVVVIGGGIYGCSILYHLTRMGWDDLVLVEKGELTSGQTWHAAGLVSHFAYDFNTMIVNKASIELYKRLEAETGQATGWHTAGTVRLGITRNEHDAFKGSAAWARYLDVPLDLVGPDEAKALLPFITTDGVLVAIHTPEDGYVDPSSVTQALAKGARDRGAEIYRHTRVTDIARAANGEWAVFTDKGTIGAEIVVAATGCFSPEIGAMVGLDLPVRVMEHQYIVTDTIPEVEAHGGEFPTLRDPRSSMYMRREQRGMVYGPYETRGAKPFAVDGMPRDFGQELLPDDLGRIAEWLELSMESLPLLRDAGVKQAINGPQSFIPDGGVLLGPAPGLDNFWLACGASVGITQGGGSGKLLAQWMVEGAAEIDMRQFDPRRFGAYASKEYALAKVIDMYQCLYVTHCPYEEREAGRPVIVSPVYDRLAARGAVFGESFGWERANWFAPQGVERADVLSFRRTNWFPHVGVECRAVRERVGVLDLSSFAKFEVSGAGAPAFLDRLSANRIPTKVGGIALAHMLNEFGGIECEMTITRLEGDRFYLLAGSTARVRDQDWMRRHPPENRGVRIEDVTMARGTLVVTGPLSRAVLATLTEADLSNEGFPWMSARGIEVAGVPVRALRVSYAGELGWELHHDIGQQAALYDAVIEAGEEHGIVDFGMRALDSMRLEKGYRALGTEMTTKTTPFEAGLDRFVDLRKDGFIGRESALARRDAGFGRVLVQLAVDAGDADAHGDEPVYSGDETVGIATSGGYGHTVGRSIAFAYVDVARAVPGTALEIEIVGERLAAEVLAAPLHDPGNVRLKS
jgi:dimethylglycine dehydrogenase